MRRQKYNNHSLDIWLNGLFCKESSALNIELYKLHCWVKSNDTKSKSKYASFLIRIMLCHYTVTNQLSPKAMKQQLTRWEMNNTLLGVNFNKINLSNMSSYGRNGNSP